MVAASSSSTNAGSAVLDTTFDAGGRLRNLPAVRITSHLAPSTDKLSAPVLTAWDLQFDCQPLQ